MKPQLPQITTDRIKVYKTTVDRGEQGVPRDVYQAWLATDDICHPIAFATIWESPVGIYLEWIEVSDGYRRRRIATELLESIEALVYGDVDAEGVTESGEAFMEFYRTRLQ